MWYLTTTNQGARSKNVMMRCCFFVLRFDARICGEIARVILFDRLLHVEGNCDFKEDVGGWIGWNM